MKAMLFAASALTLSFATQAIAQSGGAATQARSGTAAIAPLRYHYRQLANGLRVYAMPDRTTANVAVQVWYRVGSRDDPQGRSGFAHLFEHMLFKTTRNMPDRMFREITQDVGGTFNASTHPDYTDYWEIAPANNLRRLLWAESERMGSLVVDPAGLEAETDVVKEELRQRVLASPYGRLFYLYLNQSTYTRHPYGRPGIGSIEDLESASIDDVRAFHAAYYRPDNAIMVVAGNFELDEFNRWVDEYFGPIRNPDRPIPRVEVREPERTEPRTWNTYAPNVPLPAVIANYLHPGAASPDIPVLYVIDAILQQGQSSRLYNSLVYDQRIASQVLTNWEPNLDPGTYTVGAILSAGRSVDDGEAALLRELARLRNEPVSQAELDEAKNEIVTTTLQGRETAFGRSAELAGAVFSYGRPEAADELLNAIQRVTVADVQRLSRTMFAENRRVVVRYQSEESRPAGTTGDVIETASTIAARPLAVPPGLPVTELAPPESRVAPPAAGPPVAVELPAMTERRLANGMRVIVASQPGIPLISADLRVAAGASADPASRAGVSGLTATLVTQGTTTRSATQISAAVEALGATLTSNGSTDFSQVALQSRADRADEAFTIFADVVRNPAFAEAELTRTRQQQLDALAVALRQPGSIAGFVMPRAIYGDGPYGEVPSATTLAGITRADVASFHSSRWRPDNAVLVITGDITAEQGVALAERHFGNWQRPSGALPAAPDASAAAAASRTVVIDLPQTGQAAVQVGARTVSRSDRNYLPALLATYVLGGNSAARLNQEIRERRGLSYGAGANLTPRLAPGPVIAATQTRNDATVQVVGLIDTEFQRLRDTLTPGPELDARKAGLIGGFGRSVETTAGLAGQIATLALYGLPLERLNSYVGDVSRITPEQVRSAARQYFNPAGMDLVIAGDARIFYDDLVRVRPNAERIPVTELNLDREALR